VSLCAVAYSVEYMCDDPHVVRFFSYLALFTFFMIILVTAGNIIQLFIGWEGVGICSYLLINFWFTRISANKSALLAVFVNKVGDIAVLVSSGVLFTVYKTCDIMIMFGLLSYSSMQQDVLTIIGYLLLVGAVAKSAQVGLHVWLPEAMEGPTPVSSLIHAATMVTAGIFLLVRFSFILEYCPQILICCMVLGAATVFFGSSVGIFLFDVKRIVAYSTCSQLGYMLMACGFSNYSYAMFHLIGHAFFKALLFLTAGYIIHFCSGEQDFRRLGGLIKLLPSGYIFLLIGSLSLIGFPFLSGFITKEIILESSYSYRTTFMYDVAVVCQFFAGISLLFSILYSIRLISSVFLGAYNGFKWRIPKLHYSGFFILLPLLFLSFFSIAFGYVFKDVMAGEGTDFWRNSIFYMAASSHDTFSSILINNYCSMFDFLILDLNCTIHTINLCLYGFLKEYNLTSLLESETTCNISNLLLISEESQTPEIEEYQFIDVSFPFFDTDVAYACKHALNTSFVEDMYESDFSIFLCIFDNLICNSSWLNNIGSVVISSEFNKNISGVLFLISVYFLFYSVSVFLFFSRVMVIYRLNISAFCVSVYFFFAKKYPFFHNGMVHLCSVFLFVLRHSFFLIIERGFLEIFTGYGITAFVKQSLYRYLNIKAGLIYHYAGFFLLVISIWMLLLF